MFAEEGNTEIKPDFKKEICPIGILFIRKSAVILVTALPPHLPKVCPAFPQGASIPHPPGNHGPTCPILSCLLSGVSLDYRVRASRRPRGLSPAWPQTPSLPPWTCPRQGPRPVGCGGAGEGVGPLTEPEQGRSRAPGSRCQALLLPSLCQATGPYSLVQTKCKVCMAQ